MTPDLDLTRALDETMARNGVGEWGVAVNDGWELAPALPLAVSIVMRHAPEALRGLRETEMSQAFFDDYSRLFSQLDVAAASVIDLARSSGHAAVQVSNVMSAPNDDPPLADWGDAGVFPHKTAATQSGLGWIGKTAVFVSARYGPAVRLTTVFTDMPLRPGEPILESRCGRCRLCVDACPTGAGRDVAWSAGLPRDRLYDEKACEAKTWEHLEWDGTCGVCQSVCPYTKAVAGEPPRALAG